MSEYYIEIQFISWVLANYPGHDDLEEAQFERMSIVDVNTKCSNQLETTDQQQLTNEVYQRRVDWQCIHIRVQFF